MGRSEEIAAVAVFLLQTIRACEWGGVVCRRRLLGHLNSHRIAGVADRPAARKVAHGRTSRVNSRIRADRRARLGWRSEDLAKVAMQRNG